MKHKNVHMSFSQFLRTMGALVATGSLLALVAAGCVAPASMSKESGNTFQERYRPQFHYTMPKGWINDPIGLVYYRGEYHLFNDHNPFSRNFPDGLTDGEQSHWSHAVSTDLAHWKHMPIAVYPDANGACWSGSGIVDWENTSGFHTGDEPPLVLVYTSAGEPFGQSLTYSNDHGRTWTKYGGNPVLNWIAGGNRDPNVFWHEPSEKWVMVLYVRQGSASFFTSNDMKEWMPTSEVELEDFHECPDLFELPVDSNDTNKKWILYDASFRYWIGRFDGRTFVSEEGPLQGDYGNNFYAAQTWHNTKGRRIQIAWMRDGEYPDMPFNQHMSFPCELTLRTTDKGIKLFRHPVPEIEKLYTQQFELTDTTLKPGDNPLIDISGDLFDIEMEIELGDAAEFGVRLHEEEITYADGKVSCLGCTADTSPNDGSVKLRVLVDRTSLEVFANDGEISMTSCFLPKNKNTGIELYTRAGNVNIRFLRVSKLRSSWIADQP